QEYHAIRPSLDGLPAPFRHAMLLLQLERLLDDEYHRRITRPQRTGVPLSRTTLPAGAADHRQCRCGGPTAPTGIPRASRPRYGQRNTTTARTAAQAAAAPPLALERRRWRPGSLDARQGTGRRAAANAGAVGAGRAPGDWAGLSWRLRARRDRAADRRPARW